MDVTVNPDAVLTRSDLETVDRFLEGNTLATRTDLIVLTETVTDIPYAGVMTDTQLRRVALAIQRHAGRSQ